MRYHISCPYCRTTLFSGRGTPPEKIGSPFQTCRSCGKQYVDNNIYEWAILSTPRKIYYCLFANSRALLWPVPIVIALYSKILAVFCVVLCLVICLLWKRNRLGPYISQSQLRCKDSEYIDSLIRSNYKGIAYKYLKHK